MDDCRFDSLVKRLSDSDGSRRGILQTLGAGALAAVFGRFAAERDAEAKKKRKNKKKKRCKGNTTKCGKKACCRTDQTCVTGKCVAKGGVLGCQSDADCRVNEVCENGTCVAEPAPECERTADCGSGKACLADTCVVVAGTCDAADDQCADEARCNPAAGAECFCFQRISGGVACTNGFIAGTQACQSSTDCGIAETCIAEICQPGCGSCRNDADCDALEGGSVCVSPVVNGCLCAAGEGICARLCPNQ